MTNEEKLSKALQDFKTKYPSITSADLQTFIIGWQEAVKNCFIPDVSDSDLEQLAKDVFEEHEGYQPVSYQDMKLVELIQSGIEAGLRYAIFGKVK